MIKSDGLQQLLVSSSIIFLLSKYMEHLSSWVSFKIVCTLLGYFPLACGTFLYHFPHG